jgi:hypothetical protein
LVPTRILSKLILQNQGLIPKLQNFELTAKLIMTAFDHLASDLLRAVLRAASCGKNLKNGSPLEWAAVILSDLGEVVRSEGSHVGTVDLNSEDSYFILL